MSCVRSFIAIAPVLKIEKEKWGEKLFLENFIMECTYVNVRYIMQTMSIIQHINLLITVTLNNWFNQNVVGISLII